MHTERGRRLTISLSFCYTARPTHPTVLCLVAQSCPTLCSPMDCNPSGSSVHGDSPGNNTGVSCHVLLQGTFPTQGSNPGVLHCRQILYHLSHHKSLYLDAFRKLCLYITCSHYVLHLMTYFYDIANILTKFELLKDRGVCFCDLVSIN